VRGRTGPDDKFIFSLRILRLYANSIAMLVALQRVSVARLPHLLKAHAESSPQNDAHCGHARRTSMC
jgi:hypothetical protein